MILVRTFARTPLKFPLNLPVGQFDIVGQPEAWLDNKSVAIEDQNGQPHRRNALVGGKLDDISEGERVPANIGYR